MDNKIYIAMEEVSNRLENLRKSGQISNHSLNWGIDNQKLNYEIKVICKGVQIAIQGVFLKDVDGVALKIMEKLKIALQNL